MWTSCPMISSSAARLSAESLRSSTTSTRRLSARDSSSAGGSFALAAQRLRRERQPNDKLAALAGSVTSRFDTPTVQLDHALDERQSDPQSTLGEVEGRRCLRKHP